MRSKKYLTIILRLVLGTVFIVASIDKIAAPDAFAANILAYQLIPYALVNIVALVIPWMELLCGVFLVGGAYVRGSSALISVLLTVFVIAMISALLRQLKIDCGCFWKEHASPVTWMRVLEDVGLLILAVCSYVVSRSSDIPQPTEPNQGMST